MVALMDVYDAFLAKVNEDDWSRCYSKEDLEWFVQDWRSFLNSAIPYFKFPRVSLEVDDTGAFIDPDVSNEEIQILATYMKCEWLNRTIETWENVKPLYEERDFSQANLLKSFILMLEKEERKTHRLESTYYRSRANKPFDFTKLATQL